MIVAIGESVYDIIFKDGKPVSSVHGGSMYNVAISLGRSGSRVSFAGYYANDKIGKASQVFLAENNVDTRNFNLINGAKSNLALAFLDKHGVPSYTFYRDKKLSGNTMNINFLEVDVFLVGSFFAINDENFSAIKTLIHKAREDNTIIVYDPNIRNQDIHNNSELVGRVNQIMQLSDFVKMSDEDATQIIGEKNINKWHRFISTAGVNKYVITRGKETAIAIFDDEEIIFDVPKIEVVSTVGAGDATTAGILSSGTNFLSSRDEFYKSVKRGIEFGSHVCTLSENFITEDFKI
ncbi:MAG: hypothetical protein C0599_07930 [Salinivirgaceae bacterium]|nr:MAG: hypothetical protein C0599_07930 [Salinivirgaceae bacterium]